MVLRQEPESQIQVSERPLIGDVRSVLRTRPKGNRNASKPALVRDILVRRPIISYIWSAFPNLDTQSLVDGNGVLIIIMRTYG